MEFLTSVEKKEKIEKKLSKLFCYLFARPYTRARPNLPLSIVSFRIHIYDHLALCCGSWKRLFAT